MVSKQPICFILFCLLNSALVITSSRLSNETDHQALVAFKNSITKDPLNVLSSWNDSLQFCEWEGITCGARHRRVNALILPLCRLGGTLPPHIGNLTFLRKLDLLDNDIHGPIPQEISRLSRMVTLSLGNNSFQGDIPSNLSRCSALEIIHLTSNNLEGTIPPELGSLSRLSYLLISINNFSGRIPPSFGNLSSLLLLSLKRNNLEGNIPNELGQLSKLYALQLAINGLSGSIPPSIYNLSSIKNFSVAHNNLSGSILPSLGLTLPKLQILYLGENQFHGLIPSTLANASGLSMLDIVTNSFTGPLPQNFGSLDNLQYVNFAYNWLVGNLGEFIHSLSNCSKLETLLLSYNNFSSEFPRSIANLSTTLTLLGVSRANLTGSIPREIGKLTNLQYLALNENMLTGYIPNTIGKISELVRFYFYSNRILGKIPSSIGNLTKLNIVSGFDNLLERIPSSLGNCINLQAIDLQLNKFSGPIPKRLFDISNLAYGIFLNNNLFTGMLPAEVGNLMNIELFDVSNNRLSGNIPSSLGRCQVLERLYMQGNAFNGSIPESFAQLKGIRHLDLSNNHLSGHIPWFLSKLSIEYLNISNNFLEGEVPSGGVFKNISAFSVVGNDKLCGGIKELKLPVCPVENSERKRKKPLNLGLIVPLATILPIVFLLVLLSSIVYFIRRSKRVPSFSILHGKYPKLSYGDLSVATNGFSTSNLVGEGRYGSVYRVNLTVINEMVAVKVLNLQQRGANRSFTAECDALRSIRHRNLVKIITSCSSIDFKGQDFKALVYEFMPNGSLESFLHPTISEEHKFLSLIQRVNIAIDVASALDYLHNYCEPSIVHCDIKPSNILLDNDLCAHVSDFGLAKILSVTSGVSNHQSSSTWIRGTIGYVAPEYGINFEVSIEGDMFSYGILLLEMFTGKRPTSSAFVDNLSLHDYARMSLQNHVMEIVDPQILQEEEESDRNNVSEIGVCLRSILEIGVGCSQEQARLRMDAKDVLTQLHKIRKAYTSSS